MATMPRVIVLNHEDEYRFDLLDSEVTSLTTVAEVNGEHSLSMTSTRQLDKGDRILYKDGAGRWNEYVVESIESHHDHAAGIIESVNSVAQISGVVLHDYWCPWSVQHDLSGTSVTGMPGTGGTPATAAQALAAALAGTSRWAVGTVDVTTSGSASFYRMSGWDAMQVLVETWGGELDVTITVGASGVTSRTVSLLAHVGSASITRRFDYGYDVTGITRTVGEELWTARVIPLGAAERGENGGYGRKITIESVNGGVAWLQNDGTADLTRVPNGSGGWEYPVQYVENGDCETPAELLAWATANLDSWTTPKVSYEVGVVAIGADGELEGLELGDEVIVVDSAFRVEGAAIRVQARVLRIEEDLLQPSNSQITVTNLRETLGDTLSSLSQATADNAAKIANIGAFKTADATVSVPSATGTEIASVTLEAGTWVISGSARFAGNADGTQRTIDLATASGSVLAGVLAQTGMRTPPPGSSYACLNTAWLRSGGATTVYLNAYQDSGSAISVLGYVRAVRIA